MPSWASRSSTANQPRALVNLKSQCARLCALLKAARQLAARTRKLAGNGPGHFLCNAVRFDSAGE